MAVVSGSTVRLSFGESACLGWWRCALRRDRQFAVVEFWFRNALYATFVIDQSESGDALYVDDDVAENLATVTRQQCGISFEFTRALEWARTIRKVLQQAA